VRPVRGSAERSRWCGGFGRRFAGCAREVGGAGLGAAGVAALLLAACATSGGDRTRGERTQPAAEEQAAAAAAAAAAEPGPAGAGSAGIPGLRGLDHVVIGVNDLIGAATAYERLGFEVVRVNHPQDVPAAAFVDLAGGYLELVPPEPDSLGEPAPYTFEGALAQGWEVADLDAALDALRQRGVDFAESKATDLAPRAPGSLIRRASPASEPVSGSFVSLVDYDEPALRTAWERAVQAGATADPLDHPNGAAGLEYVTVALLNPQGTVETLGRWGLGPGAPARDVRGAQTSEVDLGAGLLYLTVPTGGGGVDDFLAERRALAAPVGDRYYEGGILSVGIGVGDLGETETYFQDHDVPYIPMDLAAGRTLVLQGAPAWSLRLEFVQMDGADARTGWAAHRGSGSSSAPPGSRREPDAPEAGGTAE
jgi:catechol 2,3-dioxygenase-like lactoylglutathione lyase family enzyme